MFLFECADCRRISKLQKRPERLTCRCGKVYESPAVVELPPLDVLTARYASAGAKWIAAGCPSRTDEQIIEIHDQFCKECPWFKARHCTHENCGCQIRTPAEERQTLLGRIISGALVNKLRMETEDCPDGRWGRADILHVVPRLSEKTSALSRFLCERGFRAATAPSGKIEALADAITIRQPKLVISRAFAIPVKTIRELAERFPNVNFLTVNHSSQSHLLHSASWLGDQNAFARAAMEFPNCYLGTPDERNFLGRVTGCRRIIWVPNPVRFSTQLARHAPGDPFTVCLAARRDVVKNLPQQILAVALAGRSAPLRLILTIRGDSDDLVGFARQCGVEVEPVRWTTPERFAETLRLRVQVGLQASFTESFNYAAVEQLAVGIPVVGSPAIRYLPRHWQAQPDDAESIAAILVEHCEAWEARSREAREVAQKVAERNNAAMVELAGKLIEVQSGVQNQILAIAQSP